ncbi:hypothetical protein STRTUCAR8_06859 [Streptomyces turgidiscabies Car8]|uniref:Uncharacterized protein n=1 Tax=Streptomyces turgidiscabies (strain Car8) TaxID=698760 RepID=L7ETH5_STRT8|nr:hypothetical protein STRTUCAR8_06859 [Streptomyces turgidiscabies Car8]
MRTPEQLVAHAGTHVHVDVLAEFAFSLLTAGTKRDSTVTRLTPLSRMITVLLP